MRRYRHCGKFSTLALLSVWMLCLLSTQFFAADPTLSAEIKPSADGKTVTVIFSVANNPGIAGFRFTMNYDNTVLKPVSATINSKITGFFSDNRDTATTAFNVVWATDKNYTGNGELCSAVFSVIGTVKDGKLPITITYDPADIINKDGNVVTFVTKGLTASALTVSVMTASVQSAQSNPAPSASTASQIKSSTVTSVSSAVSTAVSAFEGSFPTSMAVELNSQIPTPDYTGSQTNDAAQQQSAPSASESENGSGESTVTESSVETSVSPVFEQSQTSENVNPVQSAGKVNQNIFLITVLSVAAAAVIVLVVLIVQKKKRSKKN